MKNSLLGLIIIFLTVFNGMAQEGSDKNQKAEFKSATLITTYQKEVTEYKFISIEELNDDIEQIIKELDFGDSQKTQKNPSEIKVEIKIELAIGTAKGMMSGFIIANGYDALEAAKKLKTMLLDVIKG